MDPCGSPSPSAPPTSPSTPDPADDPDANPQINYLNIILNEDVDKEPDPPDEQLPPLNTCNSIVKFEWPSLPAPPQPTSLRFPQLISNSSFLSPMQEPGPGHHAYVPPRAPCLALVPYESKPLTTKLKGYRNRMKKNKNYNQDIKQEYYSRRLQTCCSTGDEDGVRQLLSKGLVDPNDYDVYQRAPLHLAACKGYNSIVRLLLDAGADPNQKDILGNTPLHLAACTNHFEVVTSLLRGGTDVRTLDNSGRNPLQLAESKLKLILNGGGGGKDEVRAIITMMLEYLNRKGKEDNSSDEMGLLSAFASKLTLVNNYDEDLSVLLANLQELKLSANGGGGHSSSLHF